MKTREVNPTTGRVRPIAGGDLPSWERKILHQRLGDVWAGRTKFEFCAVDESEGGPWSEGDRVYLVGVDDMGRETGHEIDVEIGSVLVGPHLGLSEGWQIASIRSLGFHAYTPPDQWPQSDEYKRGRADMLAETVRNLRSIVSAWSAGGASDEAVEALLYAADYVASLTRRDDEHAKSGDES
jgi:hypothetical protein